MTKPYSAGYYLVQFIYDSLFLTTEADFVDADPLKYDTSIISMDDAWVHVPTTRRAPRTRCCRKKSKFSPYSSIYLYEYDLDSIILRVLIRTKSFCRK